MMRNPVQQAKRFARTLVPSGLLLSRLPCSCGNSILLTFDDGPHPHATPAVLKVLKQFDARAIFFVVGDRVHRAPEMLQRILDEGHGLGNHSFSHPLDRPPGYAAYRRDLEQCQAEISLHTQHEPSLHRPPLGAITFATLFAPRAMGLRTLLWSVSSEDWRFRCDDDAERRAKILQQEISPRDIVLFHDERLHTVAALERLLPRLVERGISLCPPDSWFSDFMDQATDGRQ